MMHCTYMFKFCGKRKVASWVAAMVVDLTWPKFEVPERDCAN